MALTHDPVFAAIAEALLAQLPVANPPPPLPRGPLWERLLLEEPLALAAGLAVGAVVALVALNRQGRMRTGIALGVALALTAAAVCLLAWTVRTPREQMAAATAALVDATARVDETALDRLLADDARLFSRFGTPAPAVPGGGLDKPAIIAAVRTTLGDRWPLKEHSSHDVQAAADGPGTGRTQVRVRAVPEATGFPHGSWWLIRWRREGTQWRATSIEPLELPGAGEGMGR